MTVTREQAQMLTTLAIACRPHRAPTWDADGVMAAIGRVKERSLPEVALAVIRAAADRECANPGVIPSNGSHWQEQLKPEKWSPAAGPWCGVCGKPIEGHSSVDHEPESPPDRKRNPEQMRQIVEATKAEIQPTAASPEPRPKPETTDPRVKAVRDELTTPTDPGADVAPDETAADGGGESEER